MTRSNQPVSDKHPNKVRVPDRFKAKAKKQERARARKAAIKAV